MFTQTELDRQIYEEELQDFLPERMFDAHVHLWRKTDFARPLDPKTAAMMPGASRFPAFIREELDDALEILFPGKRCECLVFGTPLAEVDLKRANGYIQEVIAEREETYGLMLPDLGASAEALEEEVLEGGFVGFKPYWTFVEGKAKDTIRIVDMVTRAQLQVADRYGLIIMLHIPRPGRIADPVNVADLEEVCTEYPRAKIILAHVGRSYGRYFLEQAVDRIKGLENLYLDVAAVNEGEVVERLLEHVALSRVLYATDLPIALIRGKHLCVGRQCIFVTEESFAWSLSGKGPTRVQCTTMAYETVRALQWACEQRGLSRADVEKIFYGNGKGLVEQARAFRA